MKDQPPLLPVPEAQRRILAAFKATAAETIALSDALGRVLKAGLEANLTQPPFDASAMDGYAVRAADIATCPADLAVIGEAAAGNDGRLLLAPGQAIRIFTGGMVPNGADTIVIQENTTRLAEGLVRVNETAAPGRNIRLRGQDFKAGERLLAPGILIGGRQIALAAAAGCTRVKVHRRPRIGILATGNELVPLGVTPGPGQIINSNSPALAALVTLNGGIAVDMGIAADTPEALLRQASSAQDLDLLVTIGGASVGDHDLIYKILGEQGQKVDFWRIAMRPGKPLLFGDFRGVPFLGLPGNPVSSMVCTIIFILPLIRKMLGLKDILPKADEARLSQPLPANGERQEYLRANFTAAAAGPGGQLQVAPSGSQDSSLISRLAHADCLIVRPAHAPEAAIGDVVEILPLKPPAFLV